MCPNDFEILASYQIISYIVNSIGYWCGKFEHETACTAMISCVQILRRNKERHRLVEGD